MNLRSPAIIVVLLTLIGSCKISESGIQVGGNQTKIPKTFVDSKSLMPAELPYTKAHLILSGTALPVELTRTVNDSRVTFDLTGNGAVLETEVFELTEGSFQFVGLSEESFEPPVPILRFPFTVGEKPWDWSGTTNLGPNKKPATAIISSEMDSLNLAGGRFDCVRITAELTITTATDSTSNRTLRFWFEPKTGLIKREFGFSSTREPRPPGNSW